jgi:CBS-domain-containing membrane protein
LHAYPDLCRDSTALIDCLVDSNRLQGPEYQRRFVTLAPYIDQSSYRIQPTFSLERGFNLFRAMGLSHLAVVNKHNEVVGIVTRKDLTNINIHRKLDKKKHHDEEHGQEPLKPSLSDENLHRSHSDAIAMAGLDQGYRRDRGSVELAAL